MYEQLDQYYDDRVSNHPDKQDEIADVLRKHGESMKDDISVFTRLAEYYYGTDEIGNYSSYTGEEAEVGNAAHLYTLIKYQGKDIVVQVGAGEFNTAVFTRRNIPELKGFSYGPLPLFVVTAWAEQEHKQQNPRKFLNEHAVIYSPKGGQAELRMTSKQKEHPIDYGKSNGIMKYEDAVLALKNAQIHKTFPNDKGFEQFVDKMKELQKYTHEELQKRSRLKEEFLHQDDDKREFYKKALECLRYLSDENQEKMYELIQSFDLHKQVFTNS